MKNVINYYYNLYPQNIFQNHNEYYFFIDKIRYSFVKYNENIEEIEKIYNMHLSILNNMYVHPIILNKDNKPLTMIKGVPYVLMQTIYYGDEININDIVKFSGIEANIKKVHNWAELWSKKNDYIEYQIKQFGYKYKLLKISTPYYIGLGENAIQLLNITEPKNIRLYYTHKRINKKNTTYDLYNPLNIKIDTRIRDAAEFIKNKFFSGENINDDINYYISAAKLTVEEHILFFSRMLYPTYYFDLLERIIKNELEESKIKIITNKVDEYEYILKKLYKYYKTFINLPAIEWLE